jgi:hypothetical protein
MDVGVKQPERPADHTNPSCAMVRSEWSPTYTPSPTSSCRDAELSTVNFTHMKSGYHNRQGGHWAQRKVSQSTPGCRNGSRYLIRPLQLTTFITSLKGHWARTGDMGVYKQPTVTACHLCLVG